MTASLSLSLFSKAGACACGLPCCCLVSLFFVALSSFLSWVVMGPSRVDEVPLGEGILLTKVLRLGASTEGFFLGAGVGMRVLGAQKRAFSSLNSANLPFGPLSLPYKKTKSLLCLKEDR